MGALTGVAPAPASFVLQLTRLNRRRLRRGEVFTRAIVGREVCVCPDFAAVIGEIANMLLPKVSELVGCGGGTCACPQGD